MARRTVVVCGALACLLGCSTKKDDSGGIDPPAKGGMAGQAGGAMIDLTGGSAGTGGGGSGGTGGSGGSGGTTAGTAGMGAMVCPSSTVTCNDGCLTADSPSSGNCRLLVPDGKKGLLFEDMDLDQGEVFVSGGDSIYRVDPVTGALTAVTTVAETATHQLEVSGDSVFFFDQDFSNNMTVMKAPRTGGTATAMTGVLNNSGDGTLLTVGGGYLVFQGGNSTLESVPVGGGDVTTQSSGITSFGRYGAAPGGSIFYTTTVGASTTLYRGTLPFPLATAAATVAPISSSIPVLHAEDDFVYLFENKTYERVPAAGGAVEALAQAADANPAGAAFVSAEALVYTTTADEVVSLAAAGGTRTVIGTTHVNGVVKLMADADHAYVLGSFELLQFARR